MKTAVENAWLRPSPGAPPARQVLFGDHFVVERSEDGFSFGRTVKDDYPGCLPSSAFGPRQSPSLFICVRTTWAFAEPDIKSEPLMDLHMTSLLERVPGGRGTWHEIRMGSRTAFVPARHCRDWGEFFDDPVHVARQFLGTPYLWAGNTGFGLDCSGLVQAAFRACGVKCPADSHQQEHMPGDRLSPGTPLQSGDLVFWKGHVAMATGQDTLIHANSHHMAVVEERADAAIARIEGTDTGQITTLLRPDRTIAI